VEVLLRLRLIRFGCEPVMVRAVAAEVLDFVVLPGTARAEVGVVQLVRKTWSCCFEPVEGAARPELDSQGHRIRLTTAELEVEELHVRVPQAAQEPSVQAILGRQNYVQELRVLLELVWPMPEKPCEVGE
jgi:hypothetical protein